MHHNAGNFKMAMSDMAVEMTVMRCGHGCNGIIGITLKPNTLKAWVYSLHTCNCIIHDLNQIRDNEQTPPQTCHKEEMEGRIRSDAKDRSTHRSKLELCIGPLDPEHHSDRLIDSSSSKC